MDNFKLTKTDMVAITTLDDQYVNNKGAKLYVNEIYSDAIEYYRLASSMGNVQATSNLGYCYLYGRDIDINVDLAIAYFTIAAEKRSVDAAYKLGDIYSKDKWVKADKELSLYYYNMAVSFIIDFEITDDMDLRWVNRLDDYPSLCFAVAREMFIGGAMNTNLRLSYQLLKHAELGYKREIYNGVELYKESYEKVLEYLGKEEFIDVKKEYDSYYSDGE